MQFACEDEFSDANFKSLNESLSIILFYCMPQFKHLKIFLYSNDSPLEYL